MLDSLYTYICVLSFVGLDAILSDFVCYFCRSAGALLSSNDRIIASLTRLALLKLPQNTQHLHLVIRDIEREWGKLTISDQVVGLYF
jgi:hypothetical protein